MVAGANSSEGLTKLNVQRVHSHIYQLILVVETGLPVHTHTYVSSDVACTSSQKVGFSLINFSLQSSEKARLKLPV